METFLIITEIIYLDSVSSQIFIAINLVHNIV